MAAADLEVAEKDWISSGFADAVVARKMVWLLQ
jgi:hypothetical protein